MFALVAAVRPTHHAVAVIVLATAVVVAVLAALLAAARLTPWPFEAGLLALALICGALAVSIRAGLIVVVCAAVLPVCALLTLHTIKQIFDAATAARRAARPRHRPREVTGHEEGRVGRAA